MKSRVEKKNSITLSSTSDGLHLDDSILWLDSEASGQLSFLSSAADLLKSKVPQVISTEETCKILETYRRKPNALICQYNRPFSIGTLRMELLPSGSELGGASLFVETEKGRILYAPHIQTQQINTVRKMQLKKSDTLVLAATHPMPNRVLPNRKREKEKLLKTIKEYIADNKWPIIFLPPVGTAQEITKFLSDHDIPVSVHSGIYKINKVYEECDSNLGEYSLHSKRSVKNRVILYPLSTHKNLKIPAQPQVPKILIKEMMLEHELESIAQPSDIFVLSSVSDGPELKEVIAAVRPKQVYFFGPFAKVYVDEMKDLAPSVKALYSDSQPTLF